MHRPDESEVRSPRMALRANEDDCLICGHAAEYATLVPDCTIFAYTTDGSEPAPKEGRAQFCGTRCEAYWRAGYRDPLHVMLCIDDILRRC